MLAPGVSWFTIFCFYANKIIAQDSHPIYAFISRRAVTSPSMAFDGIDDLFALADDTLSLCYPTSPTPSVKCETACIDLTKLSSPPAVQAPLYVGSLLKVENPTSLPFYPAAPITPEHALIIDLTDSLVSSPVQESFILSSLSDDVDIKPSRTQCALWPVSVIDLTCSPELSGWKQEPLAISLLSNYDDIKPSIPRTQDAPQIIDVHFQVGTVFKSVDEAHTAIFSIEEKLGHIWKTDQSKLDVNGHVRKVTLHCHCSGTHVPVHLKDVDPSDLRHGRSIRTSCTAHINVNRIHSDLWHLTTVDCSHNHDREVPVGGSAPQQELVSTLSMEKFSCTQLSKILQQQLPGNPLELSQVSTIMNKACFDAQQEVAAMGGDIPAILKYIRERLSEGQDWRYDILLNTQQKVTGIWWMSPVQVKLACRYWDLLLNDDSYNRNLYGYPTNIGIVVAGDGMS